MTQPAAPLTREQRIAVVGRLLRALENNEAYLTAVLRSARYGVDVPVPRGYLEKVIRNLRKLLNLASESR